MNAENPVQIDLFGISATGATDTRLAEQIGGYRTWHAGTATTVRDGSQGDRRLVSWSGDA